MAISGMAIVAMPRLLPLPSPPSPFSSSHRAVCVASVPEQNSGISVAETASNEEPAAPSSFTDGEVSLQKEAPKPRKFYVREDKWGEILGASLGLPLRLGAGAFVQGYKVSMVPQAEMSSNDYSFFQVAGFKLKETSILGARPSKPIEIYEFEGCPFCKKVREAVSILDLDVLYYPCPGNGPNFRPRAIELGGKKQFPYMVDPNTSVSMYESDDIIKYLFEKYGNGKAPLLLSMGIFTVLTAGLAMIGRAGKGSRYVPSRQPEKPLELWAYEASPFCKVVRETLVELELPHLYHSTARGSSKRSDLIRRTGIFQVPYLEDPNTDVKMFESAEIVEYLKATYALPQP